MKQFAKLFNDTPHGQILVKLGTSHDEDGPEVRFFFYPPGLGECSIALAFEDTDAGWWQAEQAIERVDEQTAIGVIGSSPGNFIRDFQASIGLDPDSTALDGDDVAKADYLEIQQQLDELKSLYFKRGQHIETLELREKVLTAHIERFSSLNKEAFEGGKDGDYNWEDWNARMRDCLAEEPVASYGRYEASVLKKWADQLLDNSSVAQENGYLSTAEGMRDAADVLYSEAEKLERRAKASQAEGDAQ
ncbi:hypothetical protein [Vreelandella alkaliphila]|uniref:Uncharacterized protein n=1 Tax=Vreelandella alkaliphila TaxID=272774 RepID=A0AAJ2VSN0_9GAMM|nr:hypothetical protein [Halomonas alkaliphila]MDX5979590.1 hypothetical protein [Halomonas alkaliphila]